MSDQTRDRSAVRPDQAPKPESPLVDAGRVTVTYTGQPPKGPRDKEIHTRRKLPEVPSRAPRGQDE